MLGFSKEVTVVLTIVYFCIDDLLIIYILKEAENFNIIFKSLLFLFQGILLRNNQSLS